MISEEAEERAYKRMERIRKEAYEQGRKEGIDAVEKELKAEIEYTNERGTFKTTSAYRLAGGAIEAALSAARKVKKE